MKMTNHFLAVIVLCAAAVPAHAQNDVSGGNSLLLACEGQDYDGCYSYLLGVADGLMTIENVAHVPIICPRGDAGVNGAQLRLIFEKYAQQHPEQLSYQRGYVASAAFMAAFPCKR